VKLSILVKVKIFNAYNRIQNDEKFK